jgi:hypothetical protein
MIFSEHCGLTISEAIIVGTPHILDVKILKKNRLTEVYHYNGYVLLFLGIAILNSKFKL